MSIEGLILVAAIFAVFGGWIVLPLFRRERRTIHSAYERQRERLFVYYERVLRNIHDLDEDFSTGKLGEGDYQAERELWVQRGIAALKAVDELSDEHLLVNAVADNATIDEDIEAAIESAVKAKSAVARTALE